MSGWTTEQDRDLLLTIIRENVPKKGEWVTISEKFGHGKSGEACRQHFAKLIKDFPSKTVSAGTKRKAEGTDNDASSGATDEDGNTAKDQEKVKAAAKGKAKPKANAKAKTADGEGEGGGKAKRGGKAAGAGRGGRGGKKAKVEVLKEEGGDEEGEGEVEKGTFALKGEEGSEGKEEGGGESV